MTAITKVNRLNLNETTIEEALKNDHRIKSHHTKRSYMHDLMQFETWRKAQPNNRFTKTLVSSYASHLQSEGYATSTINRKLASIRWLARHLEDMAFDYLEDSERRKRVIENAKRVQTIENESGESEEKGRHVPVGEVNALFNACLNDKNEVTGVRDAAILGIAITCGLRRSEIANLKMGDVTISEGEAIIKIKHAKGDKFRKLYLYNGALNALKDWLSYRGDSDGFLFWAIRKGGHIVTDSNLSVNALYKILEKRKAESGIDQNTTWHDFRRSFAGNLLDNGTDLSTVQKLMGHASPITTSKYDRRKEDVKKNAQKGLFVPYQSA